MRAFAIVDAGTVYAVGGGGTILKTTDGGSAWVGLGNSGTARSFRGVACPSADRCWAVGESGVILATDNGGTGWASRDTGFSPYIMTVQLAPDGQTGWMAGQNGFLSKTVDGGATWTGQSSGTTAEQLNDLAVVSPTLAYVVGNSGGISKTLDGTTWQGLPSGTTNALARVQFLDANTGFAGGNNGTLRKTANAGTSWTALDVSQCTTSHVRSLAFLDTQTAWLGTMDSRICKTTNGGASWTVQYTGSGAIRALWAVDGSTVYAGGDGGQLLKSSDGGATWQSTPSGTSNGFNRLFFLDAERGYAVGWRGTIRRTVDGGKSWTALNSGGDRLLADIHLVSATRGTIVGEAGTLLSFADEPPWVFQTADGGAGWAQRDYGVTQYLLPISFAPDGRTGWLAGQSGILSKTTDGGATWTGQTSGTTSEQLNGLAVLSPTLAYVVGNSGGISKTTDGGATWTGLSSGSTNALIRVQFFDAGTGYVIGNNGTFLTTTNGGLSWTPANISACTSSHVRSLAFVNPQVGWIGTFDAYLCKTTDGGVTWTRQYTAPAAVRALWAIDTNTVHAGGDSGALLKTTNGGTAWQSLTSGSSQSIYDLSFLNSNQGYAVGGSGTILTTADGGATWVAQSSGTTKLLIRIAMLSPTKGYIVGEAGTFLAQADGAAYTYDQNGNMARRGLQKLTWDIENRPTMVVSGAVTTTFGYDAKGARVSKSVSGGATTHYVNRYYEKDVTTGEATKYYYLGDKLIGLKRGSNGVQFVMQEHLGSTAVTADGSAGSSTKYLPYGVSRSETGVIPTERKFTGQPLDASTGLYWYQSRLYDSALGRFASADSVVPGPGNPQALNRYTYVLNNPLRYVDPTGKYTEDELNEALGDDWQDTYFSDEGVFGDRPEFIDYLNSEKATDPVALQAVGALMKGARRATGDGQLLHDQLRSADALVARVGFSFPRGGLWGSAGIGPSFDVVVNFTEGSVSFFAATQGNLTVGPGASGASAEVGLAFHLPSNAAYAGAFWGPVGFAGQILGPSTSGSLGFSWDGTPSPVAVTLGGCACVGAGAGVEFSVGLEAFRDTREGRKLLPGIAVPGRAFLGGLGW